MSLKEALRKKRRVIRSGYIVACFIGGAVSILMGYPFFRDRTLLLGFFAVYILLMVGVAILIGFHILDRLLDEG